MMTAREFVFDATPQVLAGTSDVLSTNVYDAVTAKKLFDGTGTPFRVAWGALCVSGTSPTIRVRFVGADNAALTTNALILADSGVSPVQTAGTLLTGELIPQLQPTAKEFYGVIYTQGGTTPVFNVTAVGVIDGQSNMPAVKAAVP